MMRETFQKKISLSGVMLVLSCSISLISISCRTTIPAKTLSSAPLGDTFTPSGDYLIGPLDEVMVQVHGQQDLSGNYSISSSGEISFPLVGFVKAKDLTAQQLALQLNQKLIPFVKQPNVSLTVVSRKSYRVYFSGEFGRPGMVNFDQKTTLIQGVSMAGGLDRFATGRIVILRHQNQGSKIIAVDRFAADYQDVVVGKQGLDRFVLERGDVVIAE